MKLSLCMSAALLVVVSACGGKVLDQSTPGVSTTDTSPNEPTGGGSGSGSASGGGSGSGSASGSTGTTSPSTGPSGPIACGSSTCDAATQQCCLTFDSQGGASGSCTSSGKCDGDLALSCASGKNCPSGQVCCADLADDNTATATCKATCGDTSRNGDSAQLCTADSECPKGQRCEKVPGGLGICNDRRGGDH